MSWRRPTWAEVKQAALLSLSVTTQVVELVRALRGGL
jgi:hypothetical protein